MNEITLPESVDGREVYALLEKAVYEYTGGGSSSVPAETAGELLKGVCYHIAVGAGAGDCYARCERGREIALDKTRRAFGRYNCLTATALDYGNITLRDTLKGLGEFFKHYNPRLFPLDTPGDIDYQLAVALPDDIAGADYILEYIRRLSLEQRFTMRFEEADVGALLKLYNPECDHLAINVFDIVFVNAVGKALLKKARGRLIMTRGERESVINALYSRPYEFIAGEVGKAVAFLCGELNLQSPDCRWYIGLSRDSLSKRLYESLGYESGGERCELFLCE